MAKSNLPPESQPWAREIERDVRELKRATGIGDSKANLVSKANTSTFGKLQQQITALPVVEMGLGSAANYTIEPGSAGFTGWTTLAYATIVVPENARTGKLFTTGSIFVFDTTTSGAWIYTRLLISGTIPSPRFLLSQAGAAGGVIHTGYPGTVAELNVSGTQELVVELQTWTPYTATIASNTNNYAQVMAQGVFTRA